jgi:microcystin-dependent protein
MSISISNGSGSSSGGSSSSSDYYDLLVRVQALEEEMLLTYKTTSYIPSTGIATGRVTNAEFDTLRDITTTKTIQEQLNTLNQAVQANPTFDESNGVTEEEYQTLHGIKTKKTVNGLTSYITIQDQFNDVDIELQALSAEDTRLQNQINALNGEITATVANVPIGGILIWTSIQTPAGYAQCIGQLVSRTTYAKLYQVIGNTFAPEDSDLQSLISEDKFYLPDLRGVFIRGTSSNVRGPYIANGRSLGKYQLQSLQQHKHRYARPRIVKNLPRVSGNESTVWDNSVHEFEDDDEDIPFLTKDVYDQNGNNNLPNDTRPTNISMNYIIRHT